MAVTVTELEKRMAAIVNQSPDAPTAGSDDWNLWLKFLNMSQDEFADAYPWKSLFKEYNSMTSNGSGSATISLPSDFRKLAGYPKITADGKTLTSILLSAPKRKRNI